MRCEMLAEKKKTMELNLFILFIKQFWKLKKMKKTKNSSQDIYVGAKKTYALVGRWYQYRCCVCIMIFKKKLIFSHIWASELRDVYLLEPGLCVSSKHQPNFEPEIPKVLQVRKIQSGYNQNIPGVSLGTRVRQRYNFSL